MPEDAVQQQLAQLVQERGWRFGTNHTAPAATTSAAPPARQVTLTSRS